jgi:hypothetical protein
LPPTDRLPTARLRRAGALALLAGAAAYVCADLAFDSSSLGLHDWDVMESYRSLVVQSIRRFGQVPLWDPYACGGFSAWGAPESGTIVVSPLLAAYLLLPLAAALRVEIVGTLALGLAGSWLLAARFLRDPIVCAAACVVGVLSSRWALQAGAGHCWHLYYCLFPWALWAYLKAADCAEPAARLRWLAFLAAIFAAMVYAGALYPFPHTVLALGIAAACAAWRSRSWRPLAEVAGAVLGGAALAAPKLLPVAELMSRFPRRVPSGEYQWPLEYLRTLVTGHTGSITAMVPGADWGFHEYGIYVGWLGLAWLVVGNVRAPREAQLGDVRRVGLLLFWLSMGLFGPWALLHLVPPFRSQHVPTRFAYPAMLLLAIVAGASLEGWLARLRARGWSPAVVDAGLAVAALLLIVPIARESRSCLAQGFGVHLPPVAWRPVYEQTDVVPPDLAYPESNGPAGVMLHTAGVGAVFCGSFHGYNEVNWTRNGRGRPPLLGAHGRGDPEYRGEAYVDGGPGEARIERFSPNEVVVGVSGAAPGAWLVLDQNWDPGWRANGVPTEVRADLNAHRLAAGEDRVVFSYRPRTLPWGLAIAGVAIVLLALALRLTPRPRPA